MFFGFGIAIMTEQVFENARLEVQRAIFRFSTFCSYVSEKCYPVVLIASAKWHVS